MKTTPTRHDAAERMARLLHILTALRGKGESTFVPVSQLEHRTSISRRTLYRELHFLEEEGYISWSRGIGISLSAQGVALPCAAWNAEDAVALGVAQLSLHHADLVGRQALETAFSKITDTLSPGLRHLMREAVQSSTIAPSVSAHHTSSSSETGLTLSALQTIIRAIQTRRTLDMEYDSPGSGCTWRKLDPYRLEMQGNERILLHGWCHCHKEIRAFRVRRIQQVCETNRTFCWRDKLWEAYHNQDGIFRGLRGGAKAAVCVHFAPEVVRYVQEHSWPTGVQLQRDSDGRVSLVGTVQGVDGILVELLRWRRHVYVEGGAELRAAYLAELRAMTALYEK